MKIINCLEVKYKIFSERTEVYERPSYVENCLYTPYDEDETRVAHLPLYLSLYRWYEAEA